MTSPTKPLRFNKKPQKDAPAPAASAGPVQPARGDAVTPENAGLTPGRTKARLTFNTSNVRNVYANTTKVTANQTQFAIMFGMRQGPGQGSEVAPQQVELSDQMIMSPIAAKRLLKALQTVIEKLEKKHGVIQA